MTRHRYRVPLVPRGAPGASPSSGAEAGRDTKDAGFATVWATAAVAVIVSVAVVGIYLGAAVVGRHRAEASADLAALAASAHAIDGERAACAHGARVTDGMRVRLVGCRVVGWEAFVETEVAIALPVVPDGDARGRARAGPIEISDPTPGRRSAQ